MDDALSLLNDRIWRDLHAVASKGTPAPAWQNMVLSTTDLNGVPQSRMVVLRDADVDRRRIFFHTDTRSPKWEQMQKRPTVSLLVYDSERREQLRLTGKAMLHAPGDLLQNSVWNALSAWTRTTYCGGPPGHVKGAPVPQDVLYEAPTTSETEPGRSVFGVVEVQVASQDWYQHPRGDIQRAVFDFSSDGRVASARWIAP
ncbi:MAG: pyridoxamine 5'-phosphate oxidase family protein [Roseobacter sp.]